MPGFFIFHSDSKASQHRVSTEGRLSFDRDWPGAAKHDANIERVAVKLKRMRVAFQQLPGNLVACSTLRLDASFRFGSYPPKSGGIRYFSVMPLPLKHRGERG
jgi:hypothetical protein